MSNSRQIPKDINICDLTNIIAWDRSVRVITMNGRALFAGIANEVPENLYEVVVCGISIKNDTLIIIVETGRR